MAKTIQYFIFLFLPVLLNNCALNQEELGSVIIEELTTDEANFKEYTINPISIEKGDRIYFWSELDVEYESNLDLFYEIKIINSKKEILTVIKLNPFDTDARLMCSTSNVGNKKNYSCTGRIHNFLNPEGIDYINFEDSGLYSFKVIMWVGSNNPFNIKKSKLIVKK